jgi:hypothetical protein
VHHSDAINRKHFVQLLPDFAHFQERHRLVTFILQVQGAPPQAVIAHATIEGHDGSITRRADLRDQ